MIPADLADELRSIAARIGRYRFRDALSHVESMDELRKDLLRLAKAANASPALPRASFPTGNRAGVVVVNRRQVHVEVRRRSAG